MSTLCTLDSMIPKCHYMLPTETMLHVSIVLYFSKFKRNLLNFKIIHTTIKLLILDAFYMSTNLMLMLPRSILFTIIKICHK